MNEFMNHFFIFIQGCTLSENLMILLNYLMILDGWYNHQNVNLSNQIYETAWDNLSKNLKLADSKSCIVMI